MIILFLILLRRFGSLKLMHLNYFSVKELDLLFFLVYTNIILRSIFAIRIDCRPWVISLKKSTLHFMIPISYLISI